MKFPLVLLLASLCAAQDNNNTDLTFYVSSIRLQPAEVHLCSASIVREDLSLTTAKCVYGRDPKNLLVSYSHDIDSDKTDLSVYKVILHPDYEEKTHSNDLALVQASGNIKFSYYLQLPEYWRDFAGPATIFAWSFGSDNSVFALRQYNATLASREKCSVMRKEFVNCNFICTDAMNVTHGSFDEGTPLIAAKNGTEYILGIYNPAYPQIVTSSKYYSIYPFIYWLNTTISNTPYPPITTTVRNV